MGEAVKFYRSTGAKIAEHPIENGALYFATDEAKTFMDVGGERLTIYEPHNSWGFEEMEPEGPPAYLTFESEDGSDFTFQMSAKNWDGILEVSVDKLNWMEYSDISTIINSNNGKLYLRGNNNTQFATLITYGANGSTVLLSSTVPIYCSGNIETLLDWQTVVNGEHPNMNNGGFYSLFEQCTMLKSTPSLPATTLSIRCYLRMFYGCTSLESVPELPAQILTNYCYASMFLGCTSLESAPELPATTLAPSCYYSMFENCRLLKNISSLPATVLAANCYQYMFKNCQSLAILPLLPAKRLVKNCYNSMFRSCSKIKISATQTDEYTQYYEINAAYYNGNSDQYALESMFSYTGGTYTELPKGHNFYILYVSNTNIIK